MSFINKYWGFEWVFPCMKQEENQTVNTGASCSVCNGEHGPFQVKYSKVAAALQEMSCKNWSMGWKPVAC